jgi:conjugal transfer pilus assembly protein TraD
MRAGGGPVNGSRPDLESRRLSPPPLHDWRRLRWLALLAVLIFTPVVISTALMLLGAVTWLTHRTLRARGRRRREQAMLADPHRIQLGRDLRGRPVSLHETQLGAHGLILGASGSGKSTTMLSIVGQQITAGRAVVVIDLKGSRELEQQLSAAAAAAGRRLRVWTLDGESRWNPLAHGNPTELKDKLISTERFSEPHYQRAAERYVQTALQVMGELHPGREPSLSGLIELLEPRRLAQAARRLPSARGAQVQDYVRTLGRDQLSAVHGLASRLAVISESHTGRFLEPGEDAIDLPRVLEGADVVLFSLNSSSYKQLSAQLGALVVQDLVSAAGARERTGIGGLPAATVAIDEFSGLGGDHVMALIARGRSAGISVLLSTQELADLDRVSRDFRQQVIGSTAVKIAHRQDVTESAWEVARLSGTERVWERTWSEPEGRFGGGAGAGQRRVNSRLVDRHRVDPATVQSLETGEAVVITKLPSSETRLARIRPLGLGRPRADRGRER